MIVLGLVFVNSLECEGSDQCWLRLCAGLDGALNCMLNIVKLP